MHKFPRAVFNFYTITGTELYTLYKHQFCCISVRYVNCYTPSGSGLRVMSVP